MLHDIICMANNRRNTQNVVDFLKDKKFAGDIRPIVCVETIEIYDKLIDVIKVDYSTLVDHSFRLG